MQTTIRVSHIVRDKIKELAQRDGLNQVEYISRLVEREHRQWHHSKESSD